MQATTIRTMRSIVTAMALSALTISAASAEIRGLDMVVPAAPGGGWDQTARVMQEVLREEKLASRIQINNIPGAGGTIGLAQFVTAKKGRGDALMTTGYVMVGSIILNKSPVTWTMSRPSPGSPASTRRWSCRRTRSSSRSTT